jgi:hypothetical protein
MAEGFQAVKFVMLDFDEHWKRTPMITSYAYTQYKATAPRAELVVTSEGPTGTMTTYRYELEKGEEVVVFDQVVHTPAHCVTKHPGNTISCSQK